MSILRSGIDLIEVDRLAAMKPGIRERFLQRVFTPDELAYCRDQNQHLAGRFACKEAVSKALGTGIGEVAWQDIEILAEESGAPRLLLHGAAAQKAEELGLTNWSVSISHVKENAAAVAIALG